MFWPRPLLERRHFVFLVDSWLASAGAAHQRPSVIYKHGRELQRSVRAGTRRTISYESRRSSGTCVAISSDGRPHRLRASNPRSGTRPRTGPVGPRPAGPARSWRTWRTTGPGHRRSACAGETGPTPVEGCSAASEWAVGTSMWDTSCRSASTRAARAAEHRKRASGLSGLRPSSPEQQRT